MPGALGKYQRDFRGSKIPSPGAAADAEAEQLGNDAAEKYTEEDGMGPAQRRAFFLAMEERLMICCL